MEDQNLQRTIRRECLVKRWLSEAHDLAPARAWWSRRGPAVLNGAIAVMGVLALLKLADEFYRLIVSTEHNGAIDLKLRYEEVHRWFAGLPVYTDLSWRRTYPPEAYVILWPLLGWLELGPARWLWALTSLVALGGMAYLVVRESGADTPRERVFVALMLLSMNAVGVTVGNGQLIVHILPALVGALLLLRRPHAGWGTDLWAALFLLVALVKPTLTLPFVWVALFATRRIRPLVLTGAGYLLLTLVAGRFQPTPLPTLFRQWGQQTRPEIGRGYGDIQTVLASLQLGSWVMPASLAVLVALGIWTYRRRHADLWILIGIAALIARFWTYHRVYDDVLILLPMVALFRIAKRGAAADGADVKAAILLGISVAAMLAPARMERAAPPLNWLFIGGHVVVWLAMLHLLAQVARADASGPRNHLGNDRPTLLRPSKPGVDVQAL